jgi:hypothetical protein
MIDNTYFEIDIGDELINNSELNMGDAVFLFGIGQVLRNYYVRLPDGTIGQTESNVILYLRDTDQTSIFVEVDQLSESMVWLYHMDKSKIETAFGGSLTDWSADFTYKIVEDFEETGNKIPQAVA